MSLAKSHQFQNIEFFEFGYSLFGKPWITVFCYYLDGILIDTAQHKMQKAVLETFKTRKIDKILLTHYHEDHSGNAEILRKTHQAPIFAGTETGKLVSEGFKIKPYQSYFFGNSPRLQSINPLPQVIDNEHYSLTPLFTPGHSPDHYAYLEKNQGWLFSGDLYLGNLKMMRQDENIRQMIDSIKLVLQYDFEVLFCAHNPRLKDGKKAMRKKLQYLEDFCGKVKDLHQKGLSINQIIKTLGRKEIYFQKFWTFNDVGVDFMVKSAIED